MPTPAKPMPGGHQVVVSLTHRRPSPLVRFFVVVVVVTRTRRGSGRMIGGGGDDRRPPAGDRIVVADHGKRRGGSVKCQHLLILFRFTLVNDTCAYFRLYPGKKNCPGDKTDLSLQWATAKKGIVNGIKHLLRVGWRNISKLL